MHKIVMHVFFVLCLFALTTDGSAQGRWVEYSPISFGSGALLYAGGRFHRHQADDCAQIDTVEGMTKPACTTGIGNF
jgi:hypothetical protein